MEFQKKLWLMEIYAKKNIMARHEPHLSRSIILPLEGDVLLTE